MNVGMENGKQIWGGKWKVDVGAIDRWIEEVKGYIGGYQCDFFDNSSVRLCENKNFKESS
jgi:hypothetical protein